MTSKAVVLVATMILSFAVQASQGLQRKSALQPEGCVRTTINYSLVPADMTMGYDDSYWSYVNIEPGLKPRRAGKAIKEICWFRFSDDFTSKEVRKKIEASSTFLVADLWELHALGQAKPNLQRKVPIVAIGSVAKVGRYFFCPVLRGSNTERSLNIGFAVRKWSADDRFLAVRK